MKILLIFSLAQVVAKKVPGYCGLNQGFQYHLTVQNRLHCFVHQYSVAPQETGSQDCMKRVLQYQENLSTANRKIKHKWQNTCKINSKINNIVLLYSNLRLKHLIMYYMN